jgi:N-acyl-D-aspartate/D-glutamate deacylase
MPAFDLVIRGGTVVDGTGSAPREADLGIIGNRITVVGAVTDSGAEEIDAKGKLVTPGFVDIHTHYDAQAVWDTHMAPSSWHGVTTAVMGNCGVGFAPCKPADRERLIELMEGVEDIPGAVMHEGLKWEWESFSEYLDALDHRQRDIDICALLPHAAVRVFVMGDRAINLEKRQPRRHRPNASDRKRRDASWRFWVLHVPQPVAQDAEGRPNPYPPRPGRRAPRYRARDEGRRIRYAGDGLRMGSRS